MIFIFAKNNFFMWKWIKKINFYKGKMAEMSPKIAKIKIWPKSPQSFCDMLVIG